MQELVAAHALPTETPLCRANRYKDFQGEFFIDDRCHQVFSSVTTRFLFNGFLSINFP
jgi:hypothetical protein